jgi:CheY-like chemotaxis protein
VLEASQVGAALTGLAAWSTLRTLPLNAKFRVVVWKCYVPLLGPANATSLPCMGKQSGPLERQRFAVTGKKVLIVEDENLQLTSVAKRLKSAGFEVAAARDGVSTISTGRKEQPDIILLNLGSPAGDGFVVLQRLQLIIQTATIPVIVVSSRTPVGNKEAALNAGAIGYLQKPVATEVLVKAVRDALGISETDPAAGQV